MEADLLRYLVLNQGRIISRKELLEQVWRVHEDTDTRAIDNFMVRLRRYIEDNPAEPVFLETVRGIGYRFLPRRCRRARNKPSNTFCAIASLCMPEADSQSAACSPSFGCAGKVDTSFHVERYRPDVTRGGFPSAPLLSSKMSLEANHDPSGNLPKPRSQKKKLSVKTLQPAV